MANRETIAAVLVHALSASRLTQVRNIAAAHEKTWQEAVNGSNSSQLAAQKNLEDVVRAAIAELEDNSIKYILEAMEK